MVANPQKRDDREAERVGLELGVVIEQVAPERPMWLSRNADVEHQQRERDCEHPVAQRDRAVVVEAPLRERLVLAHSLRVGHLTGFDARAKAPSSPTSV